MPLYNFIIKRDNKALDPGEAVDLPDENAAWEEATKSAGEILRDLNGRFTPGSELEIEVHEESGKKIRSLRITASSHH